MEKKAFRIPLVLLFLLFSSCNENLNDESFQTPIPLEENNSIEQSKTDAGESLEKKEQTPQAISESQSTCHIRMNCDEVGDSPAFAQSGEYIQTVLNWAAKTEDQVMEYMNSVQPNVFVDDIPINSKVDFGDIYFLEEKDIYVVESRFDIGALPVGKHIIRTTLEFSNSFTDGFEWFGPDTDYPTYEGLCTILIEEVPNRGIETADILFYNGQVITIEPTIPNTEALAVKENVILAIGGNDEILPLQDAHTQLIDLNGSALLPGLIDGHTHVLAFPDRMGRSLEEALETAIRYGFTTVNEMWADQDYLDSLFQFEQEGNLRLRVNVFTPYNAGTLDENRQKIIQKTWYPKNSPILEAERHLRIPGVKIFVDGDFTPGRGCWALSEPIMPDAPILDTDICGSEYGDLYWTQDELDQVVLGAQEAGYRVAFHAMGDQAIETALNAIDFALDGQPNEIYRHQIQHNSLARPDQLSRYEDLDILTSVRGYADFCIPEGESLRAFGPERTSWYANRYMLPNLDIHAYLETDYAWTVGPNERFVQRNLDPLVHLFGLVTHKYVLEDGSVCDPVSWTAVHEISVERALEMMTIEPAYAVSMENYIGSLKPGKFADLIILSDSPLTVASDEIKDLKVWMTMVDGKVEYCDEGKDRYCPK